MKQVTRREVLRRLGGALLVAPLAHALACSEDDGGQQGADMASGEDMGADLGQDMTEQDMGADQAGQDMAAADAWATGGTAAMVAAALYPNPFTSDLGSACELHCQTTIGPCHTTSPERQDVSDGLDGLPVRLALRLVDDKCEPVEGAIIEIWHTNYLGIYSGRINSMCNEDEADRAAQYCRGYQRSDADGLVKFDTCFPGWYRGRMVHIHIRVMVGTYNAADNAEAEVITQLVFPAEVVEAIFAAEPLYKEFGQPDTTFATDNVMGGASNPGYYTVDVARMSDGAMLASKTLVIRSDGGTLCSLGR